MPFIDRQSHSHTKLSKSHSDRKIQKPMPFSTRKNKITFLVGLLSFELLSFHLSRKKKHTRFQIESIYLVAKLPQTPPPGNILAVRVTVNDGECVCVCVHMSCAH